VQQLREGPDDFFVTFLAVLEDRQGPSIEVEPDVTSGDYLLGFLLGTRRALFEKGRESITVTLPDTSARTLGALIALYERAVGFYATLVNVNAYHQPGVEAGKKAAADVIGLQRRLLAELRARPAEARTAEELAAAVGAPEEAETAFQLLWHLAANPGRGVERIAGPSLFEARFRLR
jgi:glucose-6-phosphate isomerase